MNFVIEVHMQLGVTNSLWNELRSKLAIQTLRLSKWFNFWDFNANSEQYSFGDLLLNWNFHILFLTIFFKYILIWIYHIVALFFTYIKNIGKNKTMLFLLSYISTFLKHPRTHYMYIHIFEKAISRTFKCKSKYCTLNANFAIYYQSLSYLQK